LPEREVRMAAMKTEKRPHRNCRGTSTLEFIVVLPLLMLILFAGVELSRAWMTMNVVVSAAREGARVGVVTAPFSSAAAIARMNAVLAGANLTSTVASVTCAAPCGPDSLVTATVTVNFQTLFPVLLPMIPSPLPLTETAVMRFE
jgi:Flp pilus assembly protein TadG